MAQQEEVRASWLVSGPYYLSSHRCATCEHGAESDNHVNIKQLVKQTRVGRAVLLPYRLSLATRYLLRDIALVPTWLIRSREIGNFTYQVTELFRETLSCVIAEISNVDITAVRSYVMEFDHDDILKNHVREARVGDPRSAISDYEVRPGKRLIYYVLTRTMKPRLVVEAGVDKGLGSCIISAALMRNAEEGFPGRLLACDISSDAGHLLSGVYRSVGELVPCGIEDLPDRLTGPIDLYFHDITPGAESAALQALGAHFAPGAMVVSPWHTGAMLRFSQRMNWSFRILPEQTTGTWYRGSQIVVVSGARPDRTVEGADQGR